MELPAAPKPVSATLPPPAGTLAVSGSRWIALVTHGQPVPRIFDAAAHKFTIPSRTWRRAELTPDSSALTISGHPAA
ncbi:hypothetical protein ASG92_24715 [Arthrobacter sp. Soil736]|nr:hypothetical protein ASG92_24715 [Arthrobacter sp. Soil736]